MSAQLVEMSLAGPGVGRFGGWVEAPGGEVAGVCGGNDPISVTEGVRPAIEGRK